MKEHVGEVNRGGLRNRFQRILRPKLKNQSETIATAMATPFPDTDCGEMSRPIFVALANRTIPATPTNIPARINGLRLPNFDMHRSLKTK